LTAKGSLSLILTFSSLAGTGVILSLVYLSPAKIGPISVTVWFVGLLMALSGLLTLGLYWLKQRLLGQIEQASPRLMANTYRQGFLLAGWVVAILALSSLRQLNLRDAILTLILLGLAELFFRTKAA
jgi:hypothetical protein